MVAAALVVWFVAGKLPETSPLAASVAIDIPDNPATLAASNVQDAQVVAMLPGAAGPAAGQEPLEAPPPQKALIDTIRLTLQDPELRKGAHQDDLAALEAFYADRVGPSLWTMEAGFSAEAQAVIDEIAKADEWGLESGAFALPPAGGLPATAAEQARAEIALDLAILKYARHARGGRANPAALSEVLDQTPPLRDPKTVLTEIASAEAPDAYLRSLHPKHEQFERLRQALLKARAENEAGTKPKGVERLLINMERWRWMPEDLGSLYVWLNTPEFMMHVVKDGKTIHSERVVVGKPVYATPVFSADLQSIVFNPEWTVPPTIVREDLLPKLRKSGGFFGGSNTAILKQHGLKVKYKGREVDPSKIDWNRVNMAAISFIQAPGPMNVLGKVKFLYPNKHIVYMHDTIKRDLFKKSTRAEGHHCPRVAHPGKVAALLLAEDKGWESSKIEKLMAKGNNAVVNLDHPIPVHTTYFTALVDEEGKVETFADIYKLDRVVATAIVGKDAKAKLRQPSTSGTLANTTP